MKKPETGDQAMKGYGRKKREAEGFTLIEVVIAIVILSISLVLVMQLFAGGLRAARTSCDYSRAVVHAKEKMEELYEDPIQESGTFEDGFRWETGVQTYREFEESTLKMIELKVRVMWNDTVKNPRTVELSSLKLIEEETEDE